MSFNPVTALRANELNPERPALNHGVIMHQDRLIEK